MKNTFRLYNPRKHFIIELPDGWRTIVDIEDAWLADEYQFVSRQAPRSTKRYAHVRGDCTLALHRIVLNPSKGLDVDHKNHDGLDNRRRNLRPATRAQNLANSVINKAGCTSQYRGVKLHKPSGLWRAGIGASTRSLGYFHSEQDAARAYDRAAMEQYGEFATLNFPIESGQVSA